MLKLISALDMKYENVLEYYNYFINNGYKDINDYSITLVKESKESYINYLLTYNTEELYYLVDEDNEDYILGFGSVETSEELDFHEDYLNVGSIGYGVRPNERKKGYGSKILELLLVICKEKGMNEVCISCEKGNIASEKIILKHGGVFEKHFYDEFEGPGTKYWINLK